MAKKAVLVGINRYQIPGADLRGCVNDVNNVAEALATHCGFSADDIKKVTDLDATTERMRAEMQELLGGAEPGDVLLFHYSGHGSNVPDSNGDEADFRDEILCPTDLDWYDPLVDDWIREVFDSLPDDVNLTVLFDCCHSGTATRAILPPDAEVIARYLPCPWDLVATESGRSLRGETRSTRPRGGSDVLEVEGLPELFISGCRDDQTSADAYIDGTYNGAMTYSLVSAINESNGQLTYRELHAAMLEFLDGRYTQVPQLSGQADRLDLPFLEPF